MLNLTIIPLRKQEVDMKNALHAFALAALVLASAPASPKGQTVRIEISGASLVTPLEITDAAILIGVNTTGGVVEFAD